MLTSTRGGGRRDETRELHRVGAGESSASTGDTNNTSFAKPSTTKRKIAETWGIKSNIKKTSESMSHKTTSGKVSHIVKEVLLIPDLSIKAVPKNKKMQEY